MTNGEMDNNKKSFCWYTLGLSCLVLPNIFGCGYPEQRTLLSLGATLHYIFTSSSFFLSDGTVICFVILSGVEVSAISTI